MTLQPLHLAMRRHATHPKARPWSVEFVFGHGNASDRRMYTFFAPPDAGHDVLMRIHNGILLLHPAVVTLSAPVQGDRLEDLKTLRAVHAVPVVIEGEEPLRIPRDVIDLPAREVPEPRWPSPGTLSIGLDIGGTGMKCVALDHGVPVDKASSPTWPERERGVESLIARGRGLVEQVAAGRPIGSLGIGFASPMGVKGQIVSLSTVMRQRLGGVEVLSTFAQDVSRGLTEGPVAIYNDLANLGRLLSGRGRRRTLRLQIGTSFGGCWIDADGTVTPSELGRIVVDAGPQARPHTYLPLRGAMKAYLSGVGVAQSLSEQVGRPVTAWEAGYLLAELGREGRPEAQQIVDWIADLLAGVVAETHAFLPGLREVEVGGSMLQGLTGRRLAKAVRARIDDSTEFRIARDPGYDGAVAAAQAPLIDAPIRGLARVAQRRSG